MAKKIQDALDQRFEELFRSEPIADDGFSDRVVRIIRRRLWVQRLTLPIAVAIGGFLSIKPAIKLLTFLSQLLHRLPDSAVLSAASWVPPLHLLISGVLLLVVVLMSVRMLEDT